MNGALTIGTEDGANIEMRESVGDAYWPFSFGAHADEIASLQRYNPWEIYSSIPRVKRAVDALKEGAFTQTASEKEVVEALYGSLMEGNRPDRYFVLYDLMAYYETQKNVEAYYLDPYKWTETAIHNIAGMGPFSSDKAVQKYAKEIWEVEPCLVDPAIFNDVKHTYSSALALI
jgi:starch phosphorylase